ncbi:3-hydroxyacyl-CoA dehydrogenase protein [Halorhabdus tiamatea SARL4B]|uniref:3-hydroxyacyl-CoA dehydrogenase protein n=1 Tax=Halorhabdus tiamatea SARL4B TaxID=1033806 RepID=U2E745_9EURY|nr:3-hydroxyacyl-CoA dehydrogenase protein [Halorhabdus tiamatea SARL4B]
MSDADYETLLVDVEDSVGRVTIDRPERMNAISPTLLEELADAIEGLEANDDVRAVVLAGAGDRAFSAGADLSAITEGDAVDVAELSQRGQETFAAVKECSMPVLAAIDGFCLGGGMELATHADLRIATEDAVFGQTEHNLGLMPGWGGTQRLQRIVGEGRAKEVIFTADHFDAATMAEYGFLNEVLPESEFEDRVDELAADLAAGPPIAQNLTKRAMHRGQDDIEAGLEIESRAFGLLRDTADLLEGIDAFQEDRDPEFSGE